MTYIQGLLVAATVIFGASVVSSDQKRTTSNRDRDRLIALENEWLKNEHNPTKLEHILAADFLHPVASGDILNKAQHIKFSSTHIPAPDLTKHFEDLRVRIYGDIGVVNGMVVATGKNGKTPGKTVFTDVFVYREGRWQAINAQENAIQSLAR